MSGRSAGKCGLLVRRESRTPASGRPIRKRMQIVPIFPGKLEELGRVQLRRFFAQEGFKAPLNVGTAPGAEPITAGGEPVKFEDIPQVLSRKL
jgi:hypothetical protein